MQHVISQQNNGHKWHKWTALTSKTMSLMGLWKKNPRLGFQGNQQNSCQTGMLCYSKIKDWKCKIFIISEKLVNNNNNG